MGGAHAPPIVDEPQAPASNRRRLFVARTHPYIDPGRSFLQTRRYKS